MTCDFARFRSVILRFDSFPILCSAGHMPSDDWAGRIIQDLSDLHTPAEWITAVSFSTENKFHVVLTWLKTSTKVESFVESLFENFSQSLGDALAKYFFSVSENLIVSPEWWLNLNDNQRSCLNTRITDGLPISGGINVTAPRKGEPIVVDAELLSRIDV